MGLLAKLLDQLEDVKPAEGGEAGINDGQVDRVLLDELHGLRPGGRFKGADAQGHQEVGERFVPGLLAAVCRGSRHGCEQEIESGIASHRVTGAGNAKVVPGGNSALALISKILQLNNLHHGINR